MPSSIVSPFPVFNDLDGTPLEAGYIYIGQSNLNPESAPINVFWDAALTVPAAQPIRTVGGYASRNGSPSRMYVSADTYSITVRNRNRVFVFAAFDQTDAPTSVFDISTQVITATAGQLTFTLTTFTYLPGTDTLQVYRNGLRLTAGTDYLETNSSTVTLTTAAAAGDEFLFQGGAVITGNQTPGTAVSFIQAGAGAVTRNMQDKVRESVSVKDFGAVGDGITDDTTAIQVAFNTGRQVLIPAGEYKITSTISTSNVGLSLVGEGARLSRLTFYGNSGLSFDGGYMPPGDQSDVFNQFYAEDVGFFVKNNSTVPLLTILYTGGYAGYQKLVSIQGCLFWALAGGSMPQGILLNNCRYVDIANTTIRGDWPDTQNGSLIKSVDGILLTGGLDPTTSAPVAFCFTDVNVSSFQNGITVNQFCEGVYLKSTNIVTCRVGLKWETGSVSGNQLVRPQLSVVGCHFDCSYHGLLLGGLSELNILGCLFYSRPDQLDGVPPSGYSAIRFLDNTTNPNGIISDCQFYGNRPGYPQSGIIAGAGSVGYTTRISENIFSGDLYQPMLFSSTPGFWINDNNVFSFSGWTTATLYRLYQVVVVNGQMYYCLIQHTSGTFATDLAAGKWGATARVSGSQQFDASTFRLLSGQCGKNNFDQSQERYGNVVIALDASGNGQITLSPGFDFVKPDSVVISHAGIFVGNPYNEASFAVDMDTATTTVIPIKARPAAGAFNVRITYWAKTLAKS